jgi:hypothetical protein
LCAGQGGGEAKEKGCDTMAHGYILPTS